MITALQLGYALLEEDVHFAAFAAGQEVNALKLLRCLVYALTREDECDCGKLLFLPQHLNQRQPHVPVLVGPKYMNFIIIIILLYFQDILRYINKDYYHHYKLTAIFRLTYAKEFLLQSK